jgi:hypothetical protein
MKTSCDLCGVLTMMAGLILESEKSENGTLTRTTSPFE